jgi:hypothetical protein
MRRLGTLLALGVGVFTAPWAHDRVAQTTGAPSKSGTRLITLGTVAGPPPRAHRAQSSNLLIVNGILYVVDAGDGAARRPNRRVGRDIVVRQPAIPPAPAVDAVTRRCGDLADDAHRQRTHASGHFSRSTASCWRASLVPRGDNFVGASRCGSFFPGK